MYARGEALLGTSYMICVCVCDKMSLCDFLYLILSVHIWQLVHQIYFVFDRTGSLVEEWE